MKVFIRTYGCQANSADSEAIAGLLVKQGHDLVHTEQEAETIIVNSCSVKNATQGKELHYLRKWSPRKKVIVGGCLTKTIELRKHIPELTAIFDTNSLQKVPELLVYPHDTFSDTKDSAHLQIPVIRTKKSLGIIPISQGCLNSCTYCATKHARGNLFSYRRGDIKRAVEQAVKEGCTKIYLTSQDTGCYGFDIQTTLPELLRELMEIEGEFQIRIGMMNPWHAKKILSALGECFQSKKIMPFIHLPLQSGSEKVLQHMKRIHTVKDFKEIVLTLRKSVQSLTVATDIIVGYPTETEIDFEETLKVLEEIHPEVLNISKFSSRGGTAAKKLKQLSSEIIDTRSKRLHVLWKRMQRSAPILEVL